MPNGGILEIKSYNVDNQLVVQFVDTGEGIPPEEQSRIFDPFYTTKPTGTGLGLSISYQNIKLHNGTIEVDSSPGQGTTFTIKLPIEQNTPKGGEVVDTARISD